MTDNNTLPCLQQRKQNGHVIKKLTYNKDVSNF